MSRGRKLTDEERIAAVQEYLEGRGSYEAIAKKYGIALNKFLTAFQKQTLIKKFEGMCSDAEIRQLISRIVLNERCPSTLDLLENLDKIHRLIGERQKIDFEYGKYDETTKQITYYYKKREMLPVSVIYFHERFYLKCLNEEDMKWRIYRVDRMRNILGGEVSHVRLPPEENYEGFVTDMFAPEYFTAVTLRVKKYLLDEMRESFGVSRTNRLRKKCRFSPIYSESFMKKEKSLCVWRTALKCSSTAARTSLIIAPILI